MSHRRQTCAELLAEGTPAARAELHRRGRDCSGRKTRENPSPFWATHLDQAIEAHEKRQSKLLGFVHAPGHDFNLSEVDLRGRKLQDANFRNANLRKAKLSNADLSHAHLDGATLERANLSDARLTNANLSGADLFGANLRGADLSGADLRGAIMPDGRRFLGGTPDREEVYSKNNPQRGWRP